MSETSGVESILDKNSNEGCGDITAYGVLNRFKRNQDICECGNDTDCWYRVVSGIACKYRIQDDGRRRIVDFYLPGDFFGFAFEAKHMFSVQSIEDGTVIEVYSRNNIEALADSDPAVSRLVRVSAFATAERLEQQILAVGTMSATEKVRAFLLHFRNRVDRAGQNELVLPIARYDIADLLGLSPETVCRSFTDLRDQGVISLKGPRNITIPQPKR